MAKQAKLFGASKIEKLIQPGFMTLSILGRDIVHICEAAPYAMTLCAAQKSTYLRDVVEGFNYRVCQKCLDELESRRARQKGEK